MSGVSILLRAERFADFRRDCLSRLFRQLGDAERERGGVDIVTISKRLGHAEPDITLRI